MKASKLSKSLQKNPYRLMNLKLRLNKLKLPTLSPTSRKKRLRRLSKTLRKSALLMKTLPKLRGFAKSN